MRYRIPRDYRPECEEKGRHDQLDRPGRRGRAITELRLRHVSNLRRLRRSAEPIRQCVPAYCFLARKPASFMSAMWRCSSFATHFL